MTTLVLPEAEIFRYVSERRYTSKRGEAVGPLTALTETLSTYISDREQWPQGVEPFDAAPLSGRAETAKLWIWSRCSRSRPLHARS